MLYKLEIMFACAAWHCPCDKAPEMCISFAQFFGLSLLERVAPSGSHWKPGHAGALRRAAAFLHKGPAGGHDQALHNHTFGRHHHPPANQQAREGKHAAPLCMKVRCFFFREGKADIGFLAAISSPCWRASRVASTLANEAAMPHVSAPCDDARTQWQVFCLLEVFIRQLR